ncbi:MAG: hypothetical protein GKB99_04175 [Methanocellales archaeon]|nr:hypothetical protein [Methanocellales archaeon]
MQTVIFVELKTDTESRRESQDKYLTASCDAGFPALVQGVVNIFKATNSKRKYFYLLDMLVQAGFLVIPQKMYDVIQKDSLQGISAMVAEVKILDCPQKSSIIYIQPNGEGPDIISFGEFKTIVDKHDDPLSRRFAESLGEWSTVKAGHR